MERQKDAHGPLKMTEIIKELTENKFKEIYSNEKLRNAVAFAHGVCDSNGVLKYKKALMYPLSYKVTDEQIKIADELRKKRIIEVLKENKNKLFFCGMGMEFKPLIDDGIGNHRIRTTFINKHGVKCFIELGTSMDNTFLRVDFAMFDCDKERYNYKCLETKTPELKYTYQNVLKLVNEYFSCNFKEIVVDYYNISCDGVLCESPKGE